MKMITQFRNLISTALAATVLMALAACTTTGQGSSIPSIPPAATEVLNGSLDSTLNTTVDEKGYYGLLKAEKVLNELAIGAVDFGFIKPGSSKALLVADFLKKYTSAVETAKQAKKLNDAEGVASKVAEGKALYTQILELVRG